jgi:trehalose 6-phosphate phosphatase
LEDLTLRPDCALFLDIDGTLIDLAPHPDAVVIPADLTALLQAVSQRLGGALALISGRALDMIDRLVQPLVLPAAGEHGALLRLADGRLEAGITRSVPARWREHLKAEVSDWPGIVIDEKLASIAVHYRQAPEREDAVRALVHRIAAEDSEFEVLPARMAFEIRPRGADKGTALRRFLQTPPFHGRRPVFVGDDVTDEDGILAARAAGGLGLHVARDFAGQPANVRRWLKTFAGEPPSGT